MRHLYLTVTAMQCATSSHFDTVKTRLESVITVLEDNNLIEVATAPATG